MAARTVPKLRRRTKLQIPKLRRRMKLQVPRLRRRMKLQDPKKEDEVLTSKLRGREELR